jgi:uncharacterized protein (DUF2147 family)
MKPHAFLCALFLAVWARANAADHIFGEWWTPGFNARVVIYECDNKACGKITWLWEETPQDIADEKPLVGRAIFSGLKRLAPDKWGDGRIYNPEDGRSYASDIALLTTNTLEVSGCVMLFCKRQVWRRFDAAQCPPVAAPP